MVMVFEPIRPVPPITTIFIPCLLARGPQAGSCRLDAGSASCVALGVRAGLGRPFPLSLIAIRDQGWRTRGGSGWEAPSHQYLIYEAYHSVAMWRTRAPQPRGTSGP